MKKIFLTGIIIVSSLVCHAQCAMCRAGLENNLANGDLEVGAGINTGIMYLFVTPYLALATLGFFWYRHSRAKRESINQVNSINAPQ